MIKQIRREIERYFESDREESREIRDLRNWAGLLGFKKKYINRTSGRAGMNGIEKLKTESRPVFSGRDGTGQKQ